MAGSAAQVASVKSFFCLFCQRPTAIPVKDVEKFQEHMRKEHNIFKGHIVLLAQHFTDAKENEEIKDRVAEELHIYLEIIENCETNKDKIVRKVRKLLKCPFCKEASNKSTFWRHLNLSHNIFFGHEILLASKLLTFREKEHVKKKGSNQINQHRKL